MENEEKDVQNSEELIQEQKSFKKIYNEQFSGNNRGEQLLESLILQYASFKNSAEYYEQYKWDYASKHKNEFDNLDDFENKINGLGNYNFRPYFLQRTGQNHLMQPYNIETFKSSLKILLDESVDLEQRINKFLENLRNLLKNDKHWNNKDMMPDETDASYFLFTNDYTKYLLFNPKTAFNNFVKKFNLSDLLDKNDRVKRYIKIQEYCSNVLLPKMNSILNKTHTLLDAQDFIRYVDNINSVENLRTELLEYYTNLNFTIDDAPNDYTAIKNEKNIAEVHRLNSKNTKFRVIINYDKLPENMRDNCKRVPDSYGWTLNGECWVTSRNSLDDVIRKIDSTLGNLVENNYEKHKEVDNMNIPLNQILYGPPGTGKTYNTVIKAMEIIGSNYVNMKDEKGNFKTDYSSDEYKKLKEEFDNYKNEGRIEFVTFHQSYSYEEFVEGIKPELGETWSESIDKLTYTGSDGIFKEICERAKPISKNNLRHEPIDFSNTKVFKMSLGNTLAKEDDIYNYCIENNLVSLGFEDIDFSSCKTSQDFKDHDSSWGATALERFVKWMDIGDIIIVSNGNRKFRAIAQVKGDYFYDKNTPISHSHFRKVEWLYKGDDINYSKIQDKIFSQQSIYGFFDTKKKGKPDYNPNLKTDELNKIITGNVGDEVSKPYILIIDEINRGNISKIFGELITLIEEDKRENMSVKLPYSQDTFTVPKNLYIIGTMNTSDRSIASIDIALRRRFKFKEMMPNSSLVADFDIGFNTIFDNLNNKIKLLLDRDHQIGHSYFINTKYNNSNGNNNVETLKDIWFSEILPLLNEYFYCDWEKLKLIIPGFIKKLDVPEVLKNECDDSIYEFKTFDEVTDFEKALNQEKFEQV